MNRNLPCKERVAPHLAGRLDDLRQLWDLYCEDPEAYHDDLGNLFDYGLCFDYVAPETFSDQAEGYFRYQLSWGGPADEFRIYADGSGYQWSIYRIEYWFLDWFDGASITLRGNDLEFMRGLMLDYFAGCGSFEFEFDKAMKDW